MHRHGRARAIRAFARRVFAREYVFDRINPETRGKMVSLATEQERTLFYDFVPIDLGAIRGFKTRFQLYTVPGQASDQASGRLIRKGVDGIVFVADSQAERMDANIAAMENLYENLTEYGYEPRRLPIVLRWNKRDLPNAVPPGESRTRLNPGDLPEFEAIAVEGTGVLDTLKAVSKLVIKSLS